MLVGDPPRGREVALGRDLDAGLALDRLEQDRRGPVGDRLGERPLVAVRHEGDVARQRLERLAVGRLGGQRQRAHGAAVEAALGGHDVGAAGAPGQLERRLVGLGAGVGEEHLARPPRVEQREQLLGQPDLRLGGEEVRDVAERLELRRHRRDQGRVPVAERVDRDAAEEVDVLLAVGVPDVGALAADQRQLGRPEGVHQAARTAAYRSWSHDASSCAARALRVLVSTSGSTWVPTPSLVNSSSSTACGSRPSTTVARETPALTASRQAFIFGTIPLSSVGRISASASGLISPMTSSEFGQSRKSPSTSVSTSSFSASSATARAAAAESALTLCTVPCDVGRDARDDRDPAGLDDVEHRLGPDVDDLAHEPEVDLLAVDDGVGLLGGEQPGVLAGQADRERAVLVDQPDQLALHLADEHHPDDVHRLGRGDPQPAAELRLDAELVEHPGDLRPAAVHDDGLEAGEPQERDVLGEGPLEDVVGHGVAAVLHHDDLAVVLLQPRQRRGEDVGLGRASVRRGRRS